MPVSRILLTIALIVGSLPAIASAQAPAPASNAVYPPDVNLSNVRDRQLIVVQATYPDGLTRDVTAVAKITPADAEARATRRERPSGPSADGKTELDVQLRGPFRPRSPSAVSQAAVESVV